MTETANAGGKAEDGKTPDAKTTDAPENKDQPTGTTPSEPGTEPGKKTATDPVKPNEEAGTTVSPELTAARKAAEEQRKRADKLQKDAEEREKKELEKQGKHEELAKKADERAAKAEAALQKATIDNKLTVAASAAGIKDVDAALKLVDRDNIKVNDDGTVEGVDEAVKALAESRPYLTNPTAGQQPVGAGTNPGDGGGAQTPPTFTESQISDPKFFRENEKAIMEAYKNGRIVKDPAAPPAK